MQSAAIPIVAPSLGGVETLITRPATTSHSGMSREDRERLGITDSLIRVSVGIEATEELIEDFDQALKSDGSRLIGACTGSLCSRPYSEMLSKRRKAALTERTPVHGRF